MKIGIMQGRLSEPTNGHIQEFPKRWEKEFSILENYNLIGLEWLITKGCFSNNPIFKKPKEVAEYSVTSICLDTLVDEKIINKEFLYDNLVFLCETITAFTSIRNITIPLLEASDMNDNIKREKFCILIKQIGESYPDIRFSFEAELECEKLQEIISLCQNFYVTYDTGNITSCGLDHCEYINFFGNKINNVHLKDRTFSAETVEPLTGDTPFETIFRCLRKIKYDGPFILQTARSKSGKEKETILRHKNIFESLYERCL